jgi:hypothetical protein
MGTFSGKYLSAAKAAVPLLEGSFYERYYGISYSRVRAIDDVKEATGEPTSPDFAAICVELARSGAPAAGASLVAQNGTVIEQEQILTTHNLATRFGALHLTDKLPLGDLARECFTWICRQHQLGIDNWRARLQMMKNSAYAWRQMLFFLALAQPDARAELIAWAAEHLGRQRPAFRERFAPAVRGLSHVAAGGVFDGDGRAQTVDGKARRFLGWTTARHWLMQDAASTAAAR